jgi:hypothetical protein
MGIAPIELYDKALVRRSPYLTPVTNEET